MPRPCLGVAGQTCNRLATGGSRCPSCNHLHAVLTERAKGQKRRLKGHRTGSTYGWRKLRLVILDRDGWRCTFIEGGTRCRETTNLHVDHIQSPLDGGTDDPVNLRTACARHNLTRKGQHA